MKNLDIRKIWYLIFCTCKQNDMKKLDIRKICLDMSRYLINTFFITVVFCTCKQNGWLPFFLMGETQKVGYSEFWLIAKTISRFIPFIMFARGLFGCYTYYVVEKIYCTPPMGKATKATKRDFIE